MFSSAAARPLRWSSARRDWHIRRMTHHAVMCCALSRARLGRYTNAKMGYSLAEKASRIVNQSPSPYIPGAFFNITSLMVRHGGAVLLETSSMPLGVVVSRRPAVVLTHARAVGQIDGLSHFQRRVPGAAGAGFQRYVELDGWGKVRWWWLHRVLFGMKVVVGWTIIPEGPFPG